MNRRLNFTDKYQQRVEKVEIFCRDAVNLIKLKDGEGTFFYLDPPYFNSECGHYKGYSESDFRLLLDILTKIKGKFLLSSYDSSILQEYVTRYGWNTVHITMPLTINNVNKELNEKQSTKVECLTRNYP